MTDPPPPPEPEPEPEPEPGPQPGPEPERPDRPPAPQAGGSLVLGIVVGVLFFAALVVLNILLASSVPGFGNSYLVLPLVYILVAALLAAGRRTARVGAGLFIAIGVSLLLGAGVCVALLSGIGRS
jgi:hypothetical protein